MKGNISMTENKTNTKKTMEQVQYFGTKLAVVPAVAVLDTALAVGKATYGVAKGIGSALVFIIKAPKAGVIRGNKIHNKSLKEYRFKKEANAKVDTTEFENIFEG